MQHTVTGVLLAGGLSRRMGGGDKCLLPLGGEPMLAHTAGRLADQCDGVILNANGPTTRFAQFGLPIVPDPIEGFVGPLAGVLAGCRWAAANQPNHTHIVTAAADTPFFPDNLVGQLVSEQPNNGTIVLAASGGKIHPVFGLWPIALADHLERWLVQPDNRKILKWVDLHPNKTVSFGQIDKGADQQIDPFFNINTPEDHERAENMFEVLSR